MAQRTNTGHSRHADTETNTPIPTYWEVLGGKFDVTKQIPLYTKPGQINLPGKPIDDAVGKVIEEGPNRVIDGVFQIRVRP